MIIYKSKTLFIIVMLLFNVFVVIQGARRILANRIIGGNQISINDAPYMVNLRLDGQFTCGGSLITQKCVLTAAHCVQDLSPSRLSVQAGVTNLTEPGQVSRVRSVILPAQYSRSTDNFDAAILVLDDKLNGRNIATIDLTTRRPPAGMMLKVNGWGTTSESGSISTRLRSTRVRVIPKSSCRSHYRNLASITPTMLCASIPGVRDACAGDSGGPLVRNGKQYGIVSWGIGCGRSSFPGVYTDVKAVRYWIRRNMGRC